MLKKLVDERNKYRYKEEKSKLEINKSWKKLSDLLKKYNQLNISYIKKEKDDNNNDVSDLEETKFKNKEEFNILMNELIKTKNKLKNIETQILCCHCKKNVREVIFAECCHLLLCNDCLMKYYLNGNNNKVQCPGCKQFSKKLFYASYE